MMDDSSDDERHAHAALSSSSSDDDDAEHLLGVGRRIVRKTEHYVAGPASSSAAGGGDGGAKSSPGGTKQTGLDELLREKKLRDRRASRKQLEMDAEFGEQGVDDEQLTDTALMAEHRQLVDGWSDDDGSDDEMPCAFARWEAAEAWEELPLYVPPVDRQLARTDAVARSFRDAHKRGVASELRLLLAAHKPQLSGRTQPATQPAVLRWLLGLTACSFDEGVAQQAFELLSLLLAKADALPATSAERWPQLSLIAEYINLYGTTSPVPTRSSELVMERHRSPPLSTAASTAPVGTGGAGAAQQAAPSPARASPARKRKRRGEIEVPGVGDTVKVKFKGQGADKDQFFDGKVIQTAAEGSVPADVSVLACDGSPLSARDFVVYFASDEEYWRLDAKQKNLFKIKRRAPKKARQVLVTGQSQSQSESESQSQDDGSAGDQYGEEQGQQLSIMMDDELLFPVENLRLLLTLAAEVVRRSGFLSSERSTALGLTGLCAMIAADPSTSRAWLAARSLLAALLDSILVAPAPEPSKNSAVQELTASLVAAIISPPQPQPQPSGTDTQPPETETEKDAAAASAAAAAPAVAAAPVAAAVAAAAAVPAVPEVAWRERHAAEVLWGLPPTVGGAVVRMHTTVQILADALDRFMQEPPPPPKEGSGSAASAIAAALTVTTEDVKAASAGGQAAARAAVQLADAAVAASDRSDGAAAVAASAEGSADATAKSASEAVSAPLHELLSGICQQLDGVKVKLGAVHIMRDEAWALNQLRLVEGIAETAELLAGLFELESPAAAAAASASDSAPSLSQQEEDDLALCAGWRDDLGRCMDGFQKAIKHAHGTNWTGVQAWFVTWNTRSYQRR